MRTWLAANGGGTIKGCNASVRSDSFGTPFRVWGDVEEVSPKQRWRRRERLPMPRARTPSFVSEIPLHTTAADEAAAETRLDATRNIYNAVLGESLRRLDLMRESQEYRRARAMPKAEPRSVERKPRAAAFKATLERFGFTSGSIQKFAEGCRDGCWIGDHLGSHDTQTTSLRTFRAVEQYAFGRRGRPRFKSKGRLHSIEGKSNEAVIRLRADPVLAAENLCVSRQGLHAILSARSSVTPEIAVSLCKLCGDGPDIWPRMQLAHDLWQAKRDLAETVKPIPTLQAVPYHRRVGAKHVPHRSAG